MWVKNNQPEIYDKCRHILLPKDYIRYKLTGVFASEVSDAGGMQLLDIKNRVFSDEILRLLGIERELLPDVYESPEITGYCNIKGKLSGAPVVGGAGDNAAAAVGCGAVRENRAFTTIGTSGVVYAHTEKPVIDPKGRVHTFCCAVPGKWHVMGVTQSAGLSLKWFRENFASDLSYRQMDELAEKIPIGADKLLFLPYLMGERSPHNDAAAKGCFIGLSMRTARLDMTQAVFEGVAFAIRDSLEIAKDRGIVPKQSRICGGGAKSPLWRKIMSNVINLPLMLPAQEEGPSMGSAILASVACGQYGSVREAVGRIVKMTGSEEPSAEIAQRYEQKYQTFKKLYPALKERFKEL